MADSLSQSETEVRKALATIQHTATEVANTPSLGLYYVREHIRSSLPLVAASRQELAGAQESLQDGLYASRGAEDFANILSTLLPPSLERLQDAVARATATAAAASGSDGAAPGPLGSTLGSTMDLLGLRGTSKIASQGPSPAI